jgi:hypothetical protein
MQTTQDTWDVGIEILKGQSLHLLSGMHTRHCIMVSVRCLALRELSGVKSVAQEKIPRASMDAPRRVEGHIMKIPSQDASRRSFGGPHSSSFWLTRLP